MYPAKRFQTTWVVIDLQDVEGNYKLPQNEVVTVKQELIGLMISQPPSIQPQLGEAISTIAESDFYERWESLVDVRSLAPEPRARRLLIRLPGSRVALDGRQPCHEQRRATGRPLGLQALEAAFQVRRPLHRDQLRAGQVCRPLPPALPGACDRVSKIAE